MSNRLLTRREYVLLCFVAVAIVIGSLVTVWLDRRGRSPVEKKPAVATTAVLEQELAPEPADSAPSPELARAAEVDTIVAPVQVDEIAVEVTGSVRRPGVYRFAPGATVADAIDRAGGLSEDGDTTPLNRAAPLLPATRLVVPGRRPAVRIDGRVALTVPDPVDNIRQYRADWHGPGPEVIGIEAGRSASPININTASREQLETLPGIGPKIADSIIEYRRSRPFARAEDIMEVPRIGPKTFAKLRPLITVDGLY